VSDEAIEYIQSKTATLDHLATNRNVRGELVTVRASRDRRLTLMQTWPQGYEPPNGETRNEPPTSVPLDTKP